jgi:hypothetical protein
MHSDLLSLWGEDEFVFIDEKDCVPPYPAGSTTGRAFFIRNGILMITLSATVWTPEEITNFMCLGGGVSRL